MNRIEDVTNYITECDKEVGNYLRNKYLANLLKIHGLANNVIKKD